KTVSRVLNDRPDVAPETRRKVKEIIERLEFHPSKIARRLSRGSSRTIGVISHGLKYYGPASTISGVEEMAHKLGYTVILEMLPNSEKTNIELLLQNMSANHVDGIFWAVPEITYNREYTIQLLSQLPLPIVINSTEPALNFSTVTNQNEVGGHLATRHLIEQGFQNIALVTGPLDWKEARLRKIGYEKALKEAGRPVEKRYIFEGDWTARSGALGLEHLMNQHPNIDAIFSSNDQMALGILWAANQLGLRVPENLGIVGFDDIPECAFYNPPLTTIHQETVEMGCWAIKELDRLITSRRISTETEPISIEFKAKLIIRQSSGA
ncbi:MAG: LacI family transcriptional regulator, partial [Anaerolineaceae bacterium]|nr:LacI family transcriptional regulator [Anaerolineaceae bacterium]